MPEPCRNIASGNFSADSAKPDRRLFYARNFLCVIFLNFFQKALYNHVTVCYNHTNLINHHNTVMIKTGRLIRAFMRSGVF